MTATPHFPALLLLAAGALAGCRAAVPAPEADARRAIEAAVRRYVAASNEGDADALTELYTEDAVLLPPEHAPIHGRAAIGEFWRQGTDSGLAVRTLRVEVEGSLGYLVGQYSLPPTAGEPADSGKYVMCLRRQRDGSWKLSADIWNSSAGEVEGDGEEAQTPAPSVT
jgi:uncharacterized protein (TIGR02246 family)